MKAFLSALDPVIVDEPVFFSFNTSISRNRLIRFWIWAARDAIPGIDMRFDGLVDAGNTEDAAIEICMPEILASVRRVLEDASDQEASRRLNVQIGGEEVRDQIDTILLALRSRALIDKARGFAKAISSLNDAAALGVALQTLPIKDPALMGLLMHVIVGNTAVPSRLVIGATTVVGKTTEDSLRGAGFSPLGDAILAHAQNQIFVLESGLTGMGDADAVCLSIERFHKLIRALNAYVEPARNSRWSMIIAELTKQASRRLEPRLREISGDIVQAMRRTKDSLGNDWIDVDMLLAALNGMYLLSAVREARESLALNALFDQIWNQTGQSIEALVKRSIEDYREDPNNEAVSKRLECGIKMAEIRFSKDYADVLNHTREKISLRSAVELGSY